MHQCKSPVISFQLNIHTLFVGSNYKVGVNALWCASLGLGPPRVTAEHKRHPKGPKPSKTASWLTQPHFDSSELCIKKSAENQMIEAACSWQHEYLIRGTTEDEITDKFPFSRWEDCCCSVTQSRLTLCDPKDCSTPGFPVHQLPELAQIHVHQVGDAITPSHCLLSPSPPAFNLSQHLGLYQ